MKITLKFAVLAALLVFYIVIILANVFGGRNSFEGFEDEKLEIKDTDEGLENKEEEPDLTNAVTDTDTNEDKLDAKKKNDDKKKQTDE